MNIWDIMYNKFTFKKDTITLFEAFAGIGTFHMSFNDLSKKFNFNLDVVGISEIDKYAIASYNAIHGKTKNYGSICDIQEIPKVDIFTYSFPCQDISLAGNQKGFSRNSGTRSGLLWEVERILENQEKLDKLPQILVMENVKALVGMKFKDDFIEWQLKLESLGYKNYWEVLNSKNYGIPQNRERVFMISILGEYSYNFPKPFELKLKPEDILEESVDIKYFLSIEQIKRFLESDNYNVNPSGKGINGKVYFANEISNTITTNKGEGQKICTLDVSASENFMSGRSRLNEKIRVFDTILTRPKKALGKIIYKEDKKIIEYFRHRTPLETWRLMGFSDSDFDKAASVCSNSQLYKQAGNGIVKAVAFYILKELFEEE